MSPDGLKMTSYFGERQRVGGRFWSDVLLDTFAEYDVNTSILLRATGGFGLRHHLRGDQTLTLSEDPSVMAVAVDTKERIEGLAPRVAELHTHGLLTLERAQIVRAEQATVAPQPSGPLHEETKLTIYVGRYERVGRIPAHVAVCELLRTHGVAGASVLSGVDGTSHGVRERARFFDRNVDVPTVILAVGGPIQRVLPELPGLLARPIITVERVRVCKRDGQLLARPDALPATDSAGLGVWQKLMIYTSESHLHEGHPVHRALLRRLRSGPARGATSLRGVWGFTGDHEPHGDHLLRVGRRVPVVTVLVDTPERVAASFEVVDELTQEHGLVTSEMVPAAAYLTDQGWHGGLRLASLDY
ncbi:MAG: DUF190 domain-containing protein [Actinomycetota bacterium]|nr:DUF190 domain-containing protein [Actinomycetota bacterium]